MRKLFAPFLILFLIAVSSCNSNNADRKLKGYLPVTKVIDGDTFWVDDGSEKGLKIRLIGVDAPESRRTGRKQIGYYGKEAKEYVTDLLTGKSVKLTFDVGRYDRYERTLAYVYLEDGTFLNASLVQNGYAMVMTVPPNVKYADLFVKLQQEARDNNRGLWKPDN